MYSFFRKVTLVVALGFLVSFLPQMAAQAQQPKPPSVSPIVELSERVRLTLQRSILEAEQEHKRIQTELVGKPTGWTVLPGGGVSTAVATRVGAEAATFETAYLAEVRRAPKELESYLAEWKAKKRTDSEVLLKLYSWAMAACTEGYQCHRYGLKLDVEVLESGVQHEDDLLQEQVRKTGATGQVDAARAVLWNQALARAGILHQRVSGARSRWCIELWRYYDFALAKTASPTDGHALMVADIRKHIDSTFASQRRPIKEALTTLNFGKDTV